MAMGSGMSSKGNLFLLADALRMANPFAFDYDRASQSKGA
jgi:hypothetical protein